MHNKNKYIINIYWRANLIVCSLFFCEAHTVPVSPEARFRNKDIKVNHQRRTSVKMEARVENNRSGKMAHISISTCDDQNL